MNKELVTRLDSRHNTEYYIGESLGTVYIKFKKYGEEINRINLLNFGYCKKTKEFYYNYNVHMKKEEIKLIESLEYNEENCKLLEEKGIKSKESIDKYIKKYEQAREEAELEKFKIMYKKR